jgi:hypothetical protein
MTTDATLSDTYLRSTYWCDASHPAIAELAAELTRRARNPREAAVALFGWVRDHIIYTMGEWNQRASETIAMGTGTCSNKANVLVALARSIGIPAAFHVQYVATDAYFAGAYIPMIKKLTRDVAIHVYATLFVDGRWVRCDPTDDRTLCESICAIVPHAQTLEWDGVNDAVIPFAEGSIKSDTGPVFDIDAQLSSGTRLSPAIKRVFARYVAYMRDQGKRYVVDSDIGRAHIEDDFRRYLCAVDGAAMAAAG